MRNLVGIAAVGLIAASASGQSFYASNNLADANFGTGGDELIIYDFGTAAWASVGVINVGGTPVAGGVAGLDWAGGVGNGPLIGSIGFGSGSEIYAINPADASATLLGSAPVPMADLAYNPANGKMYGTGANDTLYRDDNGDSIPETVVGNYGIGALEVGIGFDGAGNLYMHDLISDTIYRGVGDAPGSIAPLYALPFDSNFSQGLYVSGNTGYHGALNNSALTSENWSFATDGSGYNFQSVFGTAPNGLPEVEVGDLTLVPAPGALALLALAGIGAPRRRRD